MPKQCITCGIRIGGRYRYCAKCNNKQYDATCKCGNRMNSKYETCATCNKANHNWNGKAHPCEVCGRSIAERYVRCVACK